MFFFYYFDFWVVLKLLFVVRADHVDPITSSIVFRTGKHTNRILFFVVFECLWSRRRKDRLACGWRCARAFAFRFFPSGRWPETGFCVTSSGATTERDTANQVEAGGERRKEEQVYSGQQSRNLTIWDPFL